MQLEELEPVRFVLLVSLAGAVLQAVPALFLGNTQLAGLAQLTVGATLSLLWWTGAILLCWVAVRRRQFSIWRTAWHVMLALALADVLAMALSVVAASIETKGAFAQAVAREPSSLLLSNGAIILLRSPFRFAGTAVLVALGRLLLGIGNPVGPQHLTSIDRKPIT